MNSDALQSALLDCLRAESRDFESAKVNLMTPVSGGYSRLTFRVKMGMGTGDKTLILQYLPKGATGLVRVDRHIEHDLLGYLSAQNNIQAPTLIASDLQGKYFDSPAHIFEAEIGRPFIETCREAKAEQYGGLNQIVARTGAAVHNLDISDLPSSLSRPLNWDDYLTQQIEFFRQTEAESARSRPYRSSMAIFRLAI